jgi:hypothetical protein
LFRDEDEYVSKIAKTEAEACVLIDNGFEFVRDFNGNKIFRKKKYSTAKPSPFVNPLAFST